MGARWEERTLENRHQECEAARLQALGACVGTWRGEGWQGGLVSDSYPGSQVEERRHYLELTGELGEVFTVRGGDAIRFLFGAVRAVTLVGLQFTPTGAEEAEPGPSCSPGPGPCAAAPPPFLTLLLPQLTAKSCVLSEVFSGLSRERRSPSPRPQQCR